MALNTDALTTVASAQTYLGDDGAATALLELLINGYSRAVANYTQREFKSALASPDNQPRQFRYAGRGVLPLHPYEARAIDQIVLHTDQPTVSQRTLTAASPTVEGEWRAEPRGKTREGTYLWLVLPQVGVSAQWETEVTVTGDWGAGTVPADVELACLIAVAAGYRNPEAFASRGLGELDFSQQPEPDVGASLPPAARRLLYPYRRPVIP